MSNDWKLLLIGGSSATGKSYLARQLAGHYHTTVTEIDDLRIALQQQLSPSVNPDLFFFLDNPEYLNNYQTNELINNLIKVGNFIYPSLKALIEKHIACNEPIIFEGDGIIPNLINGFDKNLVKSIFIYDEMDNIRNRELMRQRGGINSNLDKQVKFSYEFGMEIKKQAENYKQTLICATPQDTLFDRTIKELENE